MPIQFRSRSVPTNPPIQYSDQTSETASGWCCGGELNTITTFYECKKQNGYWIKGASNSNYCPGPGTGCPVTSGYDPNPGACCYWEKDRSKYENKCAVVANETECKALHTGAEAKLTYNYWAGQSCFSNSGNIVCNGVKLYSYSGDNGCVADAGGTNKCFNPDDRWGNCFVYPFENTLLRKNVITTFTDCENQEGYWFKDSYSSTERKIKTRNQAALSIKSATISNDLEQIFLASMPESEFNSSTDPIIRRPTNFGSLYQGGIYIGVFEPGVSVVYGNVESGNANDYTSRGPAPQEGTKWVLIAAPYDYTVNGRDVVEYRSDATVPPSPLSSSSNGYYNTFGANTKPLWANLYLKMNGFSDWYIPSQDEWAFFAKNISADNDITISSSSYTKYQYKKLKNAPYWSSTTRTPKIDGNWFNFSYLNKNVTLTNVSSELNVRLFRRIYLTPD